jgi:hypothetical protein
LPYAARENDELVAVSAGIKRIGIDFDNTIVDYDDVFLAAARERELVDEQFQGGKEVIRAALRLMPDGEDIWRSLQGCVYGKRITDAVMFEGFDAFLRLCRAQGHRVSIVSHKTEFGHFDQARVNLRQAARAWMQARGFFDEDGYGLSMDDVFFEGSRADKIERIAGLRFTHFIDDLPEVLDDPTFPQDVMPILFTNGAAPSMTRPNAFAHWRDIAGAILK